MTPAELIAAADARFLLVAMDDDGCGTPIYCKDEAAVKAALLPLLFSVQDGETLGDEHTREWEAQAELCIEEGGLSFEGDPPIHLYKLHARAQAAAMPEPEPVAYIEHHKGGDNLTWEYEENNGCTYSKLYAAPAPDRLAALEQERAVEQEYLCRTMAALKQLTFMARTSGGTPGPDARLMEACEQAEDALSFASAAKAAQTVDRIAELEAENTDLRRLIERGRTSSEAEKALAKQIGELTEGAAKLLTERDAFAQAIDTLNGQLLAAEHENAALKAELAQAVESKDGAYLERNKCVAALSKLFPAGVAHTAIEGWSEDWHGCVYIDLPTGQVSWHFHESQAHLFAHLPPYIGKWDGHDTPEKYARLAAIDAARSAK